MGQHERTAHTRTHILDRTSVPPSVPSCLFVTEGQSPVLCAERLRLRAACFGAGVTAKHDFLPLWPVSSLKVTAERRACPCSTLLLFISSILILTEMSHHCCLDECCCHNNLPSICDESAKRDSNRLFVMMQHIFKWSNQSLPMFYPPRISCV